MCKKKGKIMFTLKNPYIVGDVDEIVYDGERVDHPRVTALCRCGGSNNMPFCDGTHAKINFSGEKERTPGKGSEKVYMGSEIIIFFNAKLCAHMGRCTKLSNVFSKEAKPWINPNGDSIENIILTITHCPSGALSYQLIGEQTVTNFSQKIKISTKKGGPLCVEGSVEITDVLNSDAELSSTEHYTLCRCGKSKNKPFCDGTHSSIGFDK